MLAKPVFDSTRLRAIAEAVEQRGKSIRNSGTLQCTREIAHHGERLDVDIEDVLGERFRLSIWDDGVFWLGITKPREGRSGGWAINEQFEGCLGELHPADVVKRLESTIANSRKALEIWRGEHLTKQLK